MTASVLPFPGHALSFIQSPEFTLNPAGLAPLAGLVTFSTSLPTQAEITVSDGDRQWTDA